MAKIKNRTAYNLKGLIRYVLKEKYETEQKSMYCSEFIMHLLNGAGVEISGNGMEQISPQELADETYEVGMRHCVSGKSRRIRDNKNTGGMKT